MRKPTLPAANIFDEMLWVEYDAEAISNRKAKITQLIAGLRELTDTFSIKPGSFLWIEALAAYLPTSERTYYDLGHITTIGTLRGIGVDSFSGHEPATGLRITPSLAELHYAPADTNPMGIMMQISSVRPRSCVRPHTNQPPELRIPTLAIKHFEAA